MNPEDSARVLADYPAPALVRDHPPPNYIGPDRLSKLLSVNDAADALEGALKRATGLGPRRTHFALAGGSLLVMPAELDSFAGVKLVTVTDAAANLRSPRIGGIYLLLDAQELTTLALLDAAALTTVRTAALSVLATRRLAVPGWSRAVVFGTGPQARSHVLALAGLRRDVQVAIVGRDRGKAERIAADCRNLGVDAYAGTLDSVATADVVCTCTNASTPLFPGELLPAHAHVNAIGSHTLDARELDDNTVVRSQLVVEARDIALREAGDIVIPIRSGTISPDHVLADLSQLVRGAAVRPDQLTVFKSVGFGLADLVAAATAYTAAVAAGSI